MGKKKDKSLNELIDNNKIKKSALMKVIKGLNAIDKNDNYKLKIVKS